VGVEISPHQVGGFPSPSADALTNAPTSIDLFAWFIALSAENSAGMIASGNLLSSATTFILPPSRRRMRASQRFAGVLKPLLQNWLLLDLGPPNLDPAEIGRGRCDRPLGIPAPCHDRAWPRVVSDAPSERYIGGGIVDTLVADEAQRSFLAQLRSGWVSEFDGEACLVVMHPGIFPPGMHCGFSHRFRWKMKRLLNAYAGLSEPTCHYRADWGLLVLLDRK
jgi:hypothetical protein